MSISYSAFSNYTIYLLLYYYNNFDVTLYLSLYQYMNLSLSLSFPLLLFCPSFCLSAVLFYLSVSFCKTAHTHGVHMQLHWSSYECEDCDYNFPSFSKKENRWKTLFVIVINCFNCSDCFKVDSLQTDCSKYLLKR